MDSANITFTKEEANALMQIIDIATKAAGLNVAEAAAILAKKIDAAFKVEAPATSATPVPTEEPAAEGEVITQ